MKVAIVHDWLVGGGAERVVEELHHLYPDAPIYTSYCTDEWRAKLDNKVVTGYLQGWPFGPLRKYIPLLRLWWFKSLNLRDYDLIISSSGNGEAKAVRPPKDALHVCYCHSPTHFYWRHYDQYMSRPGFGVFNPLARVGLKLLAGPLRRADYKAAQKVNLFIANSTHIQGDIKKYYGRESTVIHPPIQIERFNSEPGKRLARQGFVTIGRLNPYKHVELVIEACNNLDLPLTVVGRGPELASLKSMAGLNVQFDSAASDKKVVQYMRGAEAFLFAAHEDFGITPVEAMAAGTPVIAYKAGGALDYVEEHVTGLFFEKQTAKSLMDSLRHFKASDFSSKTIRAHAEDFSDSVFRAKMKAYISKYYKEERQ